LEHQQNIPLTDRENRRRMREKGYVASMGGARNA